MKRSVEVKFWLFAALAYCTPNLVAFLGARSGLFMEAVGEQLSLSFTTQLACIVSVLASFVLLVYCCHSGKIWFKSARMAVPPRALGVIVFLFQVMGLLALLLYDFERVGGVRESHNLIPRIISYITPDALFMMYYSHCRPGKVPFLNLTLYCASSALRGWSGFIVIVFVIESYFILQRTSIARALVTVCCVLLVLFGIYPKMHAIRDSIRGSIVFEEETYLEAIDSLLARLQHVIVVEITAQDADRIKQLLENGSIVSVFADNILGRKFLPRSTEGLSLQQYLALKSALTGVERDDAIEDETQMWFTHTGIAGWLFILPWYMFPSYLLFVCAVLLFPYWICSRFIGETSMVPALHCAGVLYVFHGWFGPQILFCIGCVVYVCIYRLIILIRKRKSPEIIGERSANEPGFFTATVTHWRCVEG